MTNPLINDYDNRIRITVENAYKALKPVEHKNLIMRICNNEVETDIYCCNMQEVLNELFLMIIANMSNVVVDVNSGNGRKRYIINIESVDDKTMQLILSREYI